MRTASLLRDPRYTIHDQRAMLAQRVISLALGYEDLNDQQTMLFADRTSCQDLFRRVVASLIDVPPVQPVPG
ncbi:MAG: hypothetical protein U0795_23675 [Pirellulales bacterium]